MSVLCVVMYTHTHTHTHTHTVVTHTLHIPTYIYYTHNRNYPTSVDERVWIYLVEKL
jgi:hypothetical protein